MTRRSDKVKQIATKFGLVYTLQDNIRHIYKHKGKNLTYLILIKLPTPATYLIDKKYIPRAVISDIKLEVELGLIKRDYSSYSVIE